MAEVLLNTLFIFFNVVSRYCKHILIVQNKLSESVLVLQLQSIGEDHCMGVQIHKTLRPALGNSSTGYDVA